MSWRVLILILLLATGAAAFGGMQLGDWLVAHAPIAAAPPNSAGNDPDTVVLNADGKPYLAQPPQPLVNGALGVPEAPQPVAWNEPRVSLLIVNTNPDVWASAQKVSDDELRQLTQASAKLPDGPADVIPADTPTPGQGSRLIPAQAPPMPTQPVAPAATLGARGHPDNWQEALRDELAQCARLGFFERPSCAWGARNRHCKRASADSGGLRRCKSSE